MKKLLKHFLLLMALFMVITCTASVTYAATSTESTKETESAKETESTKETETESKASEQPKIKKKKAYYRIKISGLKIHKEAGSSKKVIGKAVKGTVVTSTKYVTLKNGNTWVYIKYKNIKGWVIKKYLGKPSKGWSKVNGTWKYFKNGKVKFSSNAMYKAYNKIKNRTSNKKFYIVVDRDNFHVFVFKKISGKWTPYRSMECAVGKKGWRTPTGDFTLLSRWDILKSNHSWEYYPILFAQKNGGSFCFHSTLYYKGVSLKNISKAKLKDDTVGKAVSHGCVRLHTNNARWLWKYCVNGTRVLVY